MLASLLTAFGQNKYKSSGLEQSSYRNLKGINSQLGQLLGGDLANLRGAYSAAADRNGMPTQQQIGQAQGFASSMFNPQRVAMQQSFEDQLIQANRASAQMGRAGNDPVFRAKLAQEQTRQGAMLGAQEGAFATQYAQQMPMQQLALMQQGFDTGLSSLTQGGNYFSNILAGERQQSQYRQANDPNFMAQAGSFISGSIAELGAGMQAGAALGGGGFGGMGGGASAGGFGGTGFNMSPGVSNLNSFWNSAPMGGSSGGGYSAPRSMPAGGNSWINPTRSPMTPPMMLNWNVRK